MRANVEAGYRFGKLSLQLLERFNAKWLKSKLYVLFYAAVLHWKEHLKNPLFPLREAVQSGLETGDIEYACYSAQLHSQGLFFVGENREVAACEQGEWIALSRHFKQQFQEEYASLWRQLTLNLQGKAADPLLLVGEDFDETEILPRAIANCNQQLACCIYLAKCVLCYGFKAHFQAVENAGSAVKYEAGVTGLFNRVVNNFYASLSLLARYPSVSPAQQKRDWQRVGENQTEMKAWMERTPENYQHKFELVEAEKARVLGEEMTAMQYYERAIFSAKKFGYLHEEALANELAGEFYVSRGTQKVAQVYLRDAYFAYQSWGAIAKLRDLSQRYPQVLASAIPRQNSPIAIHQTTRMQPQAIASTFDVSTVLKASQAISDEIRFERLLDRLINVVVLEHAGATTAFLLLQRQGQLKLIAQGGTDRENSMHLNGMAIASSRELPKGLFNYVKKTRSAVVLNDATREGRFTREPYILETQPKSILGLPILYQGQFQGILYLENQLTEGAFTPERVEVLKVLSSQAANAIGKCSALWGIAGIFAKAGTAKCSVAGGKSVIKCRNRSPSASGTRSRLGCSNS